MIYFVQAGDGGPIKVGFTNNIERRFSSATTDNPADLKILGVCSGTSRYEKALHARFHAHHVRGEWFADCSEIREFIGKNCTAHAVPAGSQKKRLSPITADHKTFQKIVADEFQTIISGDPRTARELAELIGVSYRTIENYRLGETVPSGEVFMAAACVLPALRNQVLEWLGAINPKRVNQDDPAYFFGEIQRLLEENPGIRTALNLIDKFPEMAAPSKERESA